jgi:hypothetical protein
LSLTISPHSDADTSSESNQKLFVADVTADAAYPTGGYALNAPLIGFQFFSGVLLGGDDSGYIPIYNYATGNLQFFQQTTVAGPLIEVPNNTNLSTVVVRLVIFGF